MRLFSAFEISGSGLTAQRLRMDVIANNIANVNTTRTAEGGPYRRQRVVFEPREEAEFVLPLNPEARKRAMAGGSGVRVVGVSADPAAPRMVYDPGHPDADDRGYVAMPNIQLVNEMVDMISATRAYEANVAAINSAKAMAGKALEIGEGLKMAIAPINAAVSQPVTAGMLQLSQGAGMALAGQAAQSSAAPLASFQEFFADAVKQTNGLQKQAEESQQQLLVGDSDDIHGVMIAMEKADLALQLTMSVRNKVIDAYQEVMRMQI